MTENNVSMNETTKNSVVAVAALLLAGAVGYKFGKTKGLVKTLLKSN